MKPGAQRAVGLAVAVFFLEAATHGRTQGLRSASARIPEPPFGQIAFSAPPSIQLVREIDDPHTGDRWLLVRDLGRPGGPGQMILLNSAQASSRQARSGTEARTLDLSAAMDPADLASQTRPIPVIHTGDRLLLEETTPLVDARLEAVALGPALAGASLKVRLVLGGHVLLAVALGPGRVTFAPEGDRQP